MTPTTIAGLRRVFRVQAVVNGCKVARTTLSPSLRVVTSHAHGRWGWKENDRASFFSAAITVACSIAVAAATFPSLISLSISDLEAPAVCNKSLDNKEDQAHLESFKLDPEVLKAAVKELTEIVGESNISVDSEDLEFHGTPRYSHHRSSSMPDVVVMPRTTEEVSRVMKVCSKYRIPVVPYGGATSIEGHLLSLNGGVSVDMTNMNALMRLNKADCDVTAQAGLGYLDLNELLVKEGLWFPLDPGPGAKVGGMCACRCSGSTAVRYGTMRENVVSLTVVLPNGDIVKTGNRARKSAAGYDLTHIFVGSEGTLGIVTEVTLRVFKIPNVSRAMMVSFRSVESAASAVQDTLGAGIQVGRAELLDDRMMEIINEINGTSFHETSTVLFELAAEDDTAVQNMQAKVSSICKHYKPSRVDILNGPTECSNLWKLRKEALWSVQAKYPDLVPWITDVAVPISNLATLIEKSKVELEKTWIPCPIVAHAGDGNFHVCMMIDKNSARDREESRRLSEYMVKLALEMEGTCTGEHGVGTGKISYLEQELGMPAIGLMAKLKSAIDPDEIMNPGKVLRHKRNRDGRLEVNICA